VYEVYIEQTAERELRIQGLRVATRYLAQKAIGASELETIGLFMKLTRKQRLSRLCELDIDEKLIDDKTKYVIEKF